MPIDKKGLMDFLGEIDRELERKIRVTAVGGTAMTLLGLKPSTIDIDFDLPAGDVAELRKVLNALPHGFRVDIFGDGMIFSQQLPEDYAEKSIPIKSGFSNIALFALHPLDIVASKIGRLDERDLQDIGACIEEFRLAKKDVKERCSSVVYVGREENYKMNRDMLPPKGCGLLPSLTELLFHSPEAYFRSAPA